MSFTPPRPARSAIHQTSAQEGSSLAGPSRTHTTPAKNVTYSPSADLSPGLSNLKKHSLYGIEDRIIIDPGSRIWKVGFSGEPRPRKVFWATDPDEAICKEGEMWGLDLEAMADQMNLELAFALVDGVESPIRYEEVLRVIKARLTTALRKVYSHDLLTESRSRKVIIVENALLPNRIKQLISEVLFDNLKVPSVSFTSGHMLTLMATGNTTGLVVDFGYHETTVVPVYQSRVMYTHLTTTPIGGKAFLQRLKNLLVNFGTYTPPRKSRRPIRPDSKRRAGPSGAEEDNQEAEEVTAPKPVLEDVLDWWTLEDIRSRGCFVGPAPIQPTRRPDEEVDLREYAKAFLETSEASHATFTLRKNEVSTDSGCGELLVPGWIRERAAEVFFEEGDVDALSVVEVILSCLTALPMDLRKAMISSIVVSGGACMMPGFIPRLRTQLLETILQSAQDEHGKDATTSIQSSKTKAVKFTAYQLEQLRLRVRETKTQHRRPFRKLVPLASNLTILNDPDPSSGAEGNARAGSAPPFNPGLLPWIGGSIAGALQIGSQEVLREPDDNILPKPGKQAPKMPVWSGSSMAAIPDWTRGSPHALSIY
ncbi:hypothetical protein NCC49_003135 [Naganishia albida]|nr:hypothetical protein NCC49_003135 [Naganishia albida]